MKKQNLSINSMIDISDLFLLLQQKNAISIKRKLKPSNSTKILKASFFNKIIYYNISIKRVHFDMATFCLLHEEAHCSQFHLQSLAIIIAITIGMVGVFLLFFLMKLGIAGIIISLFLIILIIICFLPFSRKEEIKCDKWATQEMLRIFPPLSPLRAAEKFFFPNGKTLLTIKQKKERIVDFYHPSPEKRLAIIEKEEARIRGTRK